MSDANDLTFGIEIETTIPDGLLPVGSYHAGRQAIGLPDGWLTKYDRSIQAPAGRRGCEFVSPILKGADGIRQVLTVLKQLQAWGVKVNASTGVHVHVGWPGTNGLGAVARNDQRLKRLVTLVANFERAIYASTGTKNRERGNWCGSLQRHHDADNAQHQASHLRYHILNLTNLAQRSKQTVEFRAFSGSLNPIKIIGYIRMSLGLVERALTAKRITNFTAKPVDPTSPIHRNGEGQTCLTRLFYQLGWIKGRQSHTFGDFAVPADVEVPSIKTIKRELMKLARKYDRS